MPIPTSVTHAQLREALKPVYDLLGVTDRNVFARNSLIVSEDAITFTIPVQATLDLDGERAKSLRTTAWGAAFPEHPHDPEAFPVAHGEGEGAEWGYEIRVAIDRPWVKSPAEDVA